jgi:hypothetical protein
MTLLVVYGTEFSALRLQKQSVPVSCVTIRGRALV